MRSIDESFVSCTISNIFLVFSLLFHILTGIIYWCKTGTTPRLEEFRHNIEELERVQRERANSDPTQPLQPSPTEYFDPLT